jgi:hypothetical protein
VPGWGTRAAEWPRCGAQLPLRPTSEIDRFIAQWWDTGGSELANTQSFINGLCRLIGVEPPHGTVSLIRQHHDPIDEAVPTPTAGRRASPSSRASSSSTRSQTPLAAADIARSFKGKRAATIRPVLHALAALGMAPPE